MTDAEKFRAYVSIPYFEQAKAFLNVYWSETEKDAENVWNYAHKFVELDLDKKEEGRDLDEFNAHRFLESFKETKTVKQMREEIRRADLDFNKRLALVEFLLWKYNKNVKDFVKVPIGSDEEVTKAENKLKEVQAAFAEANARAAEAKQAFQAAKASEAQAKKTEAEAKAQEKIAKEREAEASQKEAEAKNKEAELRAAQEELEAALAELKAQEDAYNKRTEDLKQASETGGMVSRNKAKNELAQHLGTDPLPLRKAKITQEAAVKKAERATEVAKAARAVAEAAANEARKAASDATKARAQAEQAAAQAEADRVKAEKAKQAAEAALEVATAKVEEAEAYLQEVKARLPKGTAWWIDRSIAEQKKYLPQRKQK